MWKSPVQVLIFKDSGVNMFNVKVEAGFSSAHNLRGYHGKCEELHGHNWKVELVVCAENLDNVGMVCDFSFLKAELNKVLEKLDHKYLNEIEYFNKVNPVRKNKVGKGKISNGVNPTSENIAKYVYDEIKPNIKILKSVTVWENERSSATYEETSYQ